MALACSFRVAADRADLRIGLPEVKLGIIPGFGGTQRLPRLVGLIPSLDLILTGRTLDGRRARKIGLVDQVAPEAYVERQALGLLREALTDGESSVTGRLRRRLKPVPRLIQAVGPLRRKVLEQARKKTEAKASPENYPAPFRAIEAIEAACTQDLQQGLDLEARLLGELIPTRTSKNLIWLFKSQTALKTDTGDVRATPRKIQRAAVIGAGIMGGGIAQLVADREVPVRLKDLKYDAILTALATANAVWRRKLERRRIDKRELNQKMAFIAPTLDDTGLTKTDIVLRRSSRISRSSAACLPTPSNGSESAPYSPPTRLRCRSPISPPVGCIPSVSWGYTSSIRSIACRWSRSSPVSGVRRRRWRPRTRLRSSWARRR